MSGSGYLKYIYGPMYAGKTEELLWEAKRYGIRHPKIISLFPEGIECTDNPNLPKTKDGYRQYFTHGLKPYYAKKTNNLQKEIWLHKRKEQWIMLIDEIQFASKEDLSLLVQAVKYWGFIVIAAGLDLDFKRDVFISDDILTRQANAYIALRAKCHVCGEIAKYTQRLHVDGTPAREDEPIIALDGSNGIKYEARCINHHVIGHTSSRNRLER